jgi:hypothetical protein
MRIAIAIASCVSGTLVAACGGRIPRPPFAPQPTSALVEVGEPPPPARVEVLPDRPASTAVWLDGEWLWRRGRWAWLSGRWCTPPESASFSPWVFERGGDGRLWYAPGVWRNAAGTPVDPPPALSYASVQSAAVINANGSIEVTGPTLHDRPTSGPADP